MKTTLTILTMALLGASAYAAQPSDTPDETTTATVADTPLGHECDCLTDEACEEMTMENTDDRLVEACARAAHETNRAYCIALGDTSQLPWDSAPEWQRTSCRNGVRGALTGATPEQSHESWSAEKVATGWTWGPVKDPEAKQHPCLVPYDQLPPDQRAKDAIFVGVVRLVASSLGS